MAISRSSRPAPTHARIFSTKQKGDLPNGMLYRTLAGGVVSILHSIVIVFCGVTTIRDKRCSASIA